MKNMLKTSKFIRLTERSEKDVLYSLISSLFKVPIPVKLRSGEEKNIMFQVLYYAAKDPGSMAGEAIDREEAKEAMQNAILTTVFPTLVRMIKEKSGREVVLHIPHKWLPGYIHVNQSGYILFQDDKLIQSDGVEAHALAITQKHTVYKKDDAFLFTVVVSLTTPFDTLKNTLCHEFLHVIQAAENREEDPEYSHLKAANNAGSYETRGEETEAFLFEPIMKFLNTKLTDNTFAVIRNIAHTGLLLQSIQNGKINGWDDNTILDGIVTLTIDELLKNSKIIAICKRFNPPNLNILLEKIVEDWVFTNNTQILSQIKTTIQNNKYS